MTYEKLKEIWIKEEQASFKGWDFSYIDNRMQEEELPWNYKNIVLKYMDEGKVMLDMGTGGGEFLLSLKPAPGKTYATEAYPPNIELSKKVLSPHGVEVRAVIDDSKLPFEDSFFDIIINRHEAFDISEIKRILKPEGMFITQQVGGQNNRELSKFLLGKYPNITDSAFNLHNAIARMKNSGFKIIEGNEYFPKARFYDIGALVFFAKIIEWEFPDFSVENCFDKLINLHKKLLKQGFVATTEHRFYFVSIKK